ncbi:MAG: hypothetical protein WCJ30_07785, partial [Deltaproteobacteria bacterium]
HALDLALGAHLADTWIPGAELAHDQPLDRAALRAGGFYGRAWATDGGRALAADPVHPPAGAATAAVTTSAVTTSAVTTSAVTTEQGAQGAASSGMVFDDGYAWYELRNTVEPVNGRPTNRGWSLVGGARAYGPTSPHSAFRFVVKQGTRVLGEMRCDAARVPGANQGALTEECGRQEGDAVHGPMRLSATGALSVEVSFIDGATSRESALRTHRIQVLAATGVRNGSQPDATNYYVSHNDQLLSAVVMPVPTGTVVDASRGSGAPNNRGYVSFEASPTEAGLEVFADFNNQWRCRVDDQPITLPDTQAAAVSMRSIAVVHTRSSGAANPTREPVIYSRFMLALPVTWGTGRDRARSSVPLEQTPGHWACDWRNNGRTLRTFRFVVSPDGTFAAHAEEAQGLTFGPGAHLAEMVIPGDAPADQRVDPAALRSAAFYGRPWATDAGRALARAAPAIGTPTPPQPAH